MTEWRVKYDGKVYKWYFCPLRKGATIFSNCTHPSNQRKHCNFEQCPLPKRRIVKKQTTLLEMTQLEVERINE